MRSSVSQYVEYLLKKSLATSQIHSHELHTISTFCKDEGFIPLLLERLSEQDDEVFFFTAPTCLQWLQDIAQKEDTTSLLSLICERVNHKTPRYNTQHDQIMRGKDALRDHLFHLQQKDDIQTITTILLDPIIGKVYQDGDVFGYSYESVAERAIQHQDVKLFEKVYGLLKKRRSVISFDPYDNMQLWNRAFSYNNVKVMDILAEEPMSTEKAHQLLKKHLYHLYQYRAGNLPFEDTPYIRRLTNHLHVPFVFFKESNNPKLLDYYYRAMEPDKQQEMAETLLKKGIEGTQWKDYGELGNACLRLHLTQEIGTLHTSFSPKPSKKM